MYLLYVDDLQQRHVALLGGIFLKILLPLYKHLFIHLIVNPLIVSLFPL